jgi:hypothetical protein
MNQSIQGSVLHRQAVLAALYMDVAHGFVLSEVLQQAYNGSEVLKYCLGAPAARIVSTSVSPFMM